MPLEPKPKATLPHQPLAGLDDAFSVTVGRGFGTMDWQFLCGPPKSESSRCLSQQIDSVGGQS